MAIRSLEFSKRYEYVPFDLENSIEIPANNRFQNKTKYKFTVDSSNERHPIDWYSAYFDLDYKITKMDNTNYGANDAVGTINGGFGLIKYLEVEFGGVKVLNSQNINHATNVKNLMDFSKGYSDIVGPMMFHYPDTSTHADYNLYTLRRVEHGRNNADNAYEVRNFVDGTNNNYNEGFAKRKILLSGGATNNIKLPLNRFGYFQSFRDQISPNGKVSLQITLEDDDNVLFRANGVDPGRYIITKFVLWAPKMILNTSGEKMFLEKYVKPHTWTYLKENIESSPFQ